MRICFDLDDTLCFGSKATDEGTDYTSCKPMPGAAQALAGFRESGHTIIIHTARGMGRANGNMGKAQAEIASLTFKQLEAWGFEYDEIYFGKPSADIYIDDKALLASDFWKHHLGEEQWQ